MSVGKKLTLAAVAALLVGFAMVIGIQVVRESGRVHAFSSGSNVDQSVLLSAHVSGAIRFDQRKFIEDAYKPLVEGEKSTVASIITISKAGKPVTSYKSETLPETSAEAMDALAKEALEADAPITKMVNGQQLVGIGVRHGKKKRLVGALVIAWDFSALEAKINEGALQSVGVAVAVSVANLLLLILLNNRIISRPIGNMTEVMGRLSGGGNGVRHGKKKRLVGALVIAWDFSALEAKINEGALQSVGVAVAVSVANLLLLILLNNRIISRPIGNMTEVMGRLSGGDHDVEIPSVETAASVSFFPTDILDRHI